MWDNGSPTLNATVSRTVVLDKPCPDASAPYYCTDTTLGRIFCSGDAPALVKCNLTFNCMVVLVYSGRLTTRLGALLFSHLSSCLAASCRHTCFCMHVVCRVALCYSSEAHSSCKTPAQGAAASKFCSSLHSVWQTSGTGCQAMQQWQPDCQLWCRGLAGHAHNWQARLDVVHYSQPDRTV